MAKTTIYNEKSYSLWLTNKKATIYQDGIKQALRGIQPWADWINEEIYKFHPRTLEEVKKMLNLIKVPVEEKEFNRFLLEVRESIWRVIRRDPFLLKHYVMISNHQGNEMLQRIWFLYGDYWLVGDSVREIVEKWTRIDRILKVLEGLSESTKAQISFNHNGEIYHASILPIENPRLVFWGKKVPEIEVPRGKVSKSGHQYYRDLRGNLLLDKEGSQLLMPPTYIYPVKIEFLEDQRERKV